MLSLSEAVHELAKMSDLAIWPTNESLIHSLVIQSSKTDQDNIVTNSDSFKIDEWMALNFFFVNNILLVA